MMVLCIIFLFFLYLKLIPILDYKYPLGIIYVLLSISNHIYLRSKNYFIKDTYHYKDKIKNIKYIVPLVEIVCIALLIFCIWLTISRTCETLSNSRKYAQQPMHTLPLPGLVTHASANQK